MTRRFAFASASFRSVQNETGARTSSKSSSSTAMPPFGDACAWTFTLGGLWSTTSPPSGAEGAALARANDFDMLLLELRLPDMAGSDVDSRHSAVDARRAVRVHRRSSHRADRDRSDEARRHRRAPETDADGAPAGDRQDAWRTRSRCGAIGRHARANGGTAGNGRSAVAEDHATGVGGGTLGDPRSEGVRVRRRCEDAPGVATCAGVSYSSLRECCGLVGIRPHDARDLTRMLRAVIQSRRQGCAPDVLLDVSDTPDLDNAVRGEPASPPTRDPIRSRSNTSSTGSASSSVRTPAFARCGACSTNAPRRPRTAASRPAARTRGSSALVIVPKAADRRRRGRAEVWCVEQIEDLRAQLDRRAGTQRHTANQRQIDVAVRRPTHRVARRVAIVNTGAMANARY